MRTNLKKFIACLLAVIMVIGIAPITVFAANIVDSGQCGDNVYWTLDDEGTLTISGTGEMENYSWTDSPFLENSSIKSVVIENGVTSIGDYAFYFCENLASLTIPNSVTSIGYYAFRYCYSLASVTIGNSVTTIGGGAFCDCETLISVTIPDSVTTIGSSAFENCINLISITIPDSVTSIGSWAFENCQSLANIEIGNNVTTIGRYVFRYTALYNNIDAWENDVLYIGKYLIVAKSSISGKYIIKNGTKLIGNGAFYDCDNLTNVIIPNSVIIIDEDAFVGCNSLTSVTIPDSVNTIGMTALGYIHVSEYGGHWIEKIENFKIYGYKGTEAERYANENGFTFIPLASEHTHTYTSIVTKPATCTETGVRTYTCSCGDSYTETIAKTAHTVVTDKAVAAICTKSGKSEGSHCSVCKAVIKVQTTVKATGHKTQPTTTKATISKAGKTVTKCTVCGTTTKTVTIAKVSSIKLSKTSYTYNGKAKKPTVTVKDSSGKTLKSGTDYTVTYAKGRKNIGSYTVKVTLKGKYSGTKTLTFKIVPAKVTNLKAKSQTAKKVTLTWKKVSGATGYQIYMATSKNGTYKKVATIKKASTVKYTKTGLTKGKTYYFKVRAYKTVSKTNVYGAYSSVKNVKVK